MSRRLGLHSAAVAVAADAVAVAAVADGDFPVAVVVAIVADGDLPDGAARAADDPVNEDVVAAERVRPPDGVEEDDSWSGSLSTFDDALDDERSRHAGAAGRADSQSPSAIEDAIDSESGESLGTLLSKGHDAGEERAASGRSSASESRFDVERHAHDSLIDVDTDLEDDIISPLPIFDRRSNCQDEGELDESGYRFNSSRELSNSPVEVEDASEGTYFAGDSLTLS